jgi:hypothetical protein
VVESIRILPSFGDERCCSRLFQRSFQLLLGTTGHRQNIVETEALAQYTRLPQDCLRPFRKPRQTLPDDRADALRHLDHLNALPIPDIFVAKDVPPFHQHPYHLLHKEGITLRPAVHQANKLLGDLVLAHGGSDELGGAFLVQPAHRDPLYQRLPAKVP